jgi:transposase
MKQGANFHDKNQIKAGYEQGMSAEAISKRLNIVLSCVASYEKIYRPKQELSPQQRGAITRKKREAEVTLKEEVKDADTSEHENTPGGEQPQEECSS